MSDRTRDTRISTILTLLAQRGELQVRSLSSGLGVSGATVRRDLAATEENGLIRRSHGRIAAAHRGAEPPVSLRRAQHTEAKRRIGAVASSSIPSRPLTMALGGGSTVGFVARSLAGRANLTVVTNGLDTASSLMARQGVKVVVTGGSARPLSNDLVGGVAERTLRSYRFDFAVVGADGVSPQAGLTRYTAHGAEIDRIMFEQAEHTIIVADSSKLGRLHRVKTAGIRSVDTLATDPRADAALVASLRRSGVRTTLSPPRPAPPRAGSRLRRRRARLGSAAAAATAALTSVSLLAACAGPPKDNAAGVTDVRLSASRPEARGEIDAFTGAVYAEPPTLDYTVAFDYPQNTVLSNVCECLMRWTPRLTTEPGLARKAGNPDPTTRVYDLRPACASTTARR
ncbi:DeoR family transcriptional regulator [Streptomyces sp. NPDC048257]|uniref:DeoR/GlpR family DNA-binding transcription regulator n=1 Tax=Streptomyces sp. NPDC048257 TaxID=3365526 RepID=UPI003721FCD2